MTKANENEKIPSIAALMFNRILRHLCYLYGCSGVWYFYQYGNASILILYNYIFSSVHYVTVRYPWYITVQNITAAKWSDYWNARECNSISMYTVQLEQGYYFYFFPGASPNAGVKERKPSGSHGLILQVPSSSYFIVASALVFSSLFVMVLLLSWAFSKVYFLEHST